MGDNDTEEFLFKVLVVGDVGAGKTSIIKRYVHNIFSHQYKATIGVDFALKLLSFNNNKTIVRLQLWDIAGQERYSNMTRVYYKEAVGAFVVLDVNRPVTLETVTKWKNDIDAKVHLPDDRPIPVVLLANKCDLSKEIPLRTAKEYDDFCREHGFIGWFETSAKENRNIDEATRFLVKKIMENDSQNRSARSDTVQLRATSDRSSGCCSS